MRAVVPATAGRARPNKRYLFSQARAACLWRNGALEASLETFDLVIVADTAALARPMLEHGWPGKESRASLLLWICNRLTRLIPITPNPCGSE